MSRATRLKVVGTGCVRFTNSPITRGWCEVDLRGRTAFDFRELAMPKGTVHLVEGTLGFDRYTHILRVDGGGRWQLDIGRSVRSLIGKRVMVRGTRAGFDLLDVTKIWLAGEPEPRTMREIVAHLIAEFRIRIIR